MENTQSVSIPSFFTSHPYIQSNYLQNFLFTSFLGNSNRTCRVPSLIGEDYSIGGVICVSVWVSSVACVVCELQRIKNNNNRIMMKNS